MNLRKGDHFWTIQVKGWDGILALPILRECVVTGGGDVYVIYDIVAINDSSVPAGPEIRFKRHQLANVAYPTRESALAAGEGQLITLRANAARETQAATEAISSIIERMES